MSQNTASPRLLELVRQQRRDPTTGEETVNPKLLTLVKSLRSPAAAEPAVDPAPAPMPEGEEGGGWSQPFHTAEGMSEGGVSGGAMDYSPPPPAPAPPPDPRDMPAGKGVAMGVARGAADLGALPGRFQQIAGGLLSGSAMTRGLPGQKGLEALGADVQGPATAVGEALIQKGKLEAEPIEAIKQAIPKSPSAQGFQPGKWRWWTENLAEQGPQTVLGLGAAGTASSVGASKLGQVAVSLLPVFGLEAAEAHQQARTAMVARGVPPGQADAQASLYALGVGVVNAAVETIPMNEIIRGSPVGRALLSKLAGMAGPQVAQRAAGGFATEATAEAIQGTNQILSRSLAAGSLPEWSAAMEEIGGQALLGGGQGSGTAAITTPIFGEKGQKAGKPAQKIPGNIPSRSAKLIAELEAEIERLRGGLETEAPAETSPPGTQAVAPSPARDDQAAPAPASGGRGVDSEVGVDGVEPGLVDLPAVAGAEVLGAEEVASVPDADAGAGRPVETEVDEEVVEGGDDLAGVVGGVGVEAGEPGGRPGVVTPHGQDSSEEAGGAKPEAIVNPIDRKAAPEEKVRQIVELSKKNAPLVQEIIDELDAELGTKSNLHFKEPAKILEKSHRPSILARKPWHGVEHIRDALRFKTPIKRFEDFGRAVDVLRRRGVKLVKIDTAKVFEPGEWGFRIAVLDLRLPNGQIIEYYLPLEEIETAKHATGHAIFEKWRNLTPEQINARIDEYAADRIASNQLYEAAFGRALARLGLDMPAARALWTQVAASVSGTRRKGESSSEAPVMAGPRSQAPEDARKTATMVPSGPEATTSTSPVSGSLTTTEDSPEPATKPPSSDRPIVGAPSKVQRGTPAAKRRIKELRKLLKAIPQKRDHIYDIAINLPERAKKLEAELDREYEALSEELQYHTQWFASHEAASVGEAKPASVLDALSPEKQARADVLKAKIKEKLAGTALKRGAKGSRPGAVGFDPELFSAGAELAALYLEAGAKKFGQFAQALIKDLGDGIRPYLKSLYKAARDMPGVDPTGMDPDAKVDALNAIWGKTVDTEPEKAEDAGDVQPGIDSAVPDAGGPGPRGDQAPAPAEPGATAGEAGGLPGRGGEPAGGQRPGPGGGDVVRADQPASGAGVVAPEPEPAAEPGAAVGGERGGAPRVPGRVRADHVIATTDLAPRGVVGKLDANLAAIRTLKMLEAERRDATPEEQAVLAKYTGWGWAGSLLDPRKDEWAKHRSRIEKLLTEEELESAKRSTLNAHYTAIEVIDAMWDAVRRLGFRGGSVLEPAAGIGHFFGRMPAELRDESQLGAVELDSLSGRILGKLYPGADVRVEGFQDAAINNNSVDLAISNVPFGSFKIHGRDYSNLAIHDYFFMRALDKVRPGGLVAFISTHFTLDKANVKLRQLLADRADLVGAIRLPNNAFRDNAGTDVTTDIIFLRKKAGTFKGETFGALEKVGEHEVKREGKEPFQAPILVNEYFARHPEMVLGVHSMAGEMYGGSEGSEYTLNPRKGVSLKEAMAAAVGKLPQLRAMNDPESIREAMEATGGEESLAAERGMRTFTHVLAEEDGSVRQVIGDQRAVPEWMRKKAVGDGIKYDEPITKAEAERRQAVAKDWVKLRDAVRDLVKAQQRADVTEGYLAQLRSQLETAYEGFVKEWTKGSSYRSLGHTIRSREPAGFMASDPDYYLVQGIEEEEVYTAKNGDVKRRWVKGPIFTERTFTPRTKPTTAKDVDEAMAVSLGWFNEIRDDELASLLGVSLEEARARALKTGRVFEDHASGTLIPRERYLSGNVRKRLAEARAAAEQDPRYAPNVAALEAVQPADVPISDIRFELGARWIPGEVVEGWVRDVLGSRSTIRYSRETNGWVIDVANRSTEAITTTYGTPDMNAVELLRHALNGTSPTITMRVDEKTVQDTEAMTAAREAIKRMRVSFQEWALTTDSLVDWKGEKALPQVVMEEVFNQTANSVVPPTYDGSHLVLPGISDVVRRTPHRMSFIARVLQEGSAVQAHGVGSGKTYGQIALAMEMRRLGLAKKPLIVVQKATLGQFAASFLKAYPQARILVATEATFQARNRKRLMAQIAAGDFDAIIVTQPQFDRIPNKPESMQAYLWQKVQELDEILFSLDKEQDAKTIKQIEAAKQVLQNRMLAAIEKMADRQDVSLYWEDLGVDALLIDEAHAYKRIPIVTRKTRVKGIPTDHSDRAIGAEIKAKQIHDRFAGKNVILSTGTPITNTTAEAYVMLKLATPRVLEEFGITNFDEFADTFGSMNERTEWTWAGKFRRIERFTKLINGPELVAMIRAGFDVKLGNKELGLDVPEIKGGKPEMLILKPTAAQQTLNDWIIDIGNTYEGLTPKEKYDNSWVPIVTMGMGLSAAVDPRLVDPSLPDDPGSKVNTAVRNILEIHKETADFKGVQVVFIDRFREMNTDKLRSFAGSPGSTALTADDLADTAEDESLDEEQESEKRAEAETREYKTAKFNLYKEIKAKLIKAGVPENEVAIIHDYEGDKKREDLFRKLNAGAIRVVLGSTEKLGVGVNIQERLIAAHHIDPPRTMTPAMMEQRNGRIIRQHESGTLPAYRKEVRIIYYGVERSMDAGIYEKLEVKQRAISQMLSGQMIGREFEDAADEISPVFREMMAQLTGDPRVIKEVELGAQVLELAQSKSAFDRAKSDWQKKRSQAMSSAAWHRGEAEGAGKLAETLKQALGDMGDDLTASFTIGDKDFPAGGRKEVVELLDRFIKSTRAKAEVEGRTNVEADGQLGPFPLYLASHRHIDKTTSTDYRLAPAKGKRAIIHGTINSGQGLLASIRSHMDPAKRIKEHEAQAEAFDAKARELEGKAKEVWPNAERLAEMEGELKKLRDSLAAEAKRNDEKAERRHRPAPPPEAAPEGERPAVLEAAYEALPAEKQAELDRLESEQRRRGGFVKPAFAGGRAGQASIDPRDFYLAVRIGTLYAEGGIRAFAQFARAMVARFGRGIIPHLKRIYGVIRANVPDDIAAGMDTPEAVEAADADALASQPLEEVQDLTDLVNRAQAQPAGMQTYGRPELANPATDEPSRRLVNVADELRKNVGEPEVRKDVDVFAEARRRVDANVAGERERLLKIVQDGGQLSDVDTVIAKELVDRVALDAVVRADTAGYLEAIILADAYRRTGTEQARAFRQRRDQTETPAERARRFLGELITEPAPETKKALDKLEEQEKQAPTEEGKKVPRARRRKVLEGEAEKVKEIAAKLREQGIHPGQLTPEQLADPRVAARIARAVSTARARPWHWATEWWINAILSGPQTHAANITGNAAFGAWRLLPERLVESVAGAVLRAEGAPRLGEYRAMLQGLFPGLWRAARNFITALDTEMPVFEDELARARGEAPPTGEIGGKIEGRAARAAIPTVAGRTIRIPTRILLATDEFFKGFYGTLEAYAHARRQSREEGLKGAAAARRAAELVMDLASPVWQQGLEEARRLTFQDDTKLASALIKARDIHPVLLFFLPFVRTPINIFKAGLARTPVLTELNMLRKLARDGLVAMKWKDGAYEYSRAAFVGDVARSLIAWGVVLALWSLVGGGGGDDEPLITGTAPRESGARDLAYRTAPPMSIKIGGKWYSYARVEPMATMLGLTVDGIREVKAIGRGKDVSEALGRLFSSLGRQIEDKTFLRGVSDIVRIFGEEDVGGRGAVRWAADFATSWVPNIIRQPGRTSDEALRETRVWGDPETVWQRLADRTMYKAFPWANRPPPKVDLWGREIIKPEIGPPATSMLYRVLSPAEAREEDVSALDRLILNWNNENPNELFAPRMPRPTFTRRGVSYSMTDKEYHDFLVEAGKAARGRLLRMGLNYEAPTERDLESIGDVLSQEQGRARDRLAAARAEALARKQAARRPAP